MNGLIKEEIEILRKEADAAVQAYYSLKTAHELLSNDNRLFKGIQANSYFWATVFHGLQTVYFLSLRKFYDPNNRSHRFEKLIKLCESQIGLFSKESLAKRREKDFSSREALNSYVRKAFVPQKGFFDNFKLRVYKELENLNFKEVYQKITDKVIAHNEVAQRDEIESLFEETNPTQVEQIILLMERISTELWSLWMNGHEPILKTNNLPLSELVIKDTRKVFADLSYTD